MPDPKWLEAVKLPTKVTAGLFLAGILLIFFDHHKIISLDDFGLLAWLIVIILTVLFGALSFTAVVAIVIDQYRKSRQKSFRDAQRAMRKEERDEAILEDQKAVLTRLDYLTKEEISYIASSLRSDEQTFYTYVHTPAVGSLIVKGIVEGTGGTHNQDHYPFVIRDFAWRALLKRKEEFIQKDDANERE